eukprot:gene13877-13996_t
MGLLRSSFARVSASAKAGLEAGGSESDGGESHSQLGKASTAISSFGPLSSEPGDEELADARSWLHVCDAVGVG